MMAVYRMLLFEPIRAITFGYQKTGLLLYPGAELAGEVIVADIGFPEYALEQVKPDTFYYGVDDLKLLPARKLNGHKGTFGKVLVIAGSKGMSGAAFLSAKAAYRTGAGLVKILTSSDNRGVYRPCCQRLYLPPMILVIASTKTKKLKISLTGLRLL